jgi:hypothetical protein
MRRPEADHERGVVAPLYGGCGFTTFATSARVHPIGVTPGISDLIVHADPIGIAFYHETKVDKRQSLDQVKFMQSAHASGMPYVLGDVTSANAWLCWLGLAEPLNETIRFRARQDWAGIVWRKRRAFDGDLALGWQGSPEHAAQVARWGYRPSTGPLKRRAARRA